MHPKDADSMANYVDFDGMGTAVFLSFRTDRTANSADPDQTALYTVCHSLCIIWMYYSMVKPPCLNFRVITLNFLVSEFLEFLRYFLFAQTRLSESLESLTIFKSLKLLYPFL